MEWASKEELCEGVCRQTEKQDDGSCRKKAGPSTETTLRDPCTDADDADGDDRRHEISVADELHQQGRQGRKRAHRRTRRGRERAQWVSVKFPRRAFPSESHSPRPSSPDRSGQTRGRAGPRARASPPPMRKTGPGAGRSGPSSGLRHLDIARADVNQSRP